MKAILIAAFGLAFPGLAQNSITLVRAGYDDPSVIRIAPGQTVTLFAAGLKTIVPGGVQRAATVPWPLSLAGISASLVQTQPGASPTLLRPLPLYSVEQFNRCVTPNPAAACLVTAITIQIPFDIIVPNPLADYIVVPASTTITISENGSVSQAFTVSAVPDQIHVLTSCDINGQTRGTGVCFPLVTHANGTLVLQAARGPNQEPLTDSEAKPGETLVMYAYGLGRVSANATAGDIPPSPVPTTATPMYMRYDYRMNATPSKPLDPGASAVPQPAFAGLAPQEVGLYSINFVVPAPPAGTQPCGAYVSSNLTVSLMGSTFGSGYSFDGAAICVDTSGQ